MKEIIVYCEDIPRPQAVAWPDAVAGDNRIVLLYADTDSFKGHFNALLKLLSESEKDQAGRFRRENQRDAYILNHSLLRIFLSRASGIPPKEILFKSEAAGKPYTEAEGLPHFNISDTDTTILQGFAPFPLGVDIEAVSPDMDIEPISGRFFSVREIRRIHKKGREWFFKYWSRKEALLKATGIGITTMLPCIEVVGGVNILNKRCTESFTGAPEGFSIKSFPEGNLYVSVASGHREAELLLCTPAPSDLAGYLR